MCEVVTTKRKAVLVVDKDGRAEQRGVDEEVREVNLRVDIAHAFQQHEGMRREDRVLSPRRVGG